MRIFKTLTLVALLGYAPLSNASAVKVFDVLLDKGQFEFLLNSRGVMSKSVVTEVRKNVRYSLEDLAKSGSGSVKELAKMKKFIKDPQDKAKYQSMMKAFNKDVKDVKAQELTEAINNLVYLSQRYGLRKQAILACAPCVNKELSDAGFSFTLTKLKDQNSKRIFKEMSRKGKNPEQTAKYLTTAVNAQKVGKFAKVKPHEEEALMYFLMIPEHGTTAQKRLYEAMKKVSKTKSGEVDIFDANNGHSFYNIFSDSMSDNELELWADLLDDTAKLMNDENMETMEAFYSVLQRRADNVSDEAEKADLTAKLEYIKREGCFARK